MLIVFELSLVLFVEMSWLLNTSLFKIPGDFFVSRVLAEILHRDGLPKEAASTLSQPIKVYMCNYFKSLKNYKT